ncbi:MULTISPECIES: STAS domain-containing protein [Micromonospora]|uniref:STAS domain-containing protein n=1 Tax=Micromonospora TaxID=1873 RepID=UPI000B85A946|nr:STAS domain-containing protein [Micromonospora yangpuensis]
MTFTVTYAPWAPGAMRLRLGGELDLSTVGQLHTVLDRLLDDGARHFLVDLTDLVFCDSTGMAAFVRGDNRAERDGGWLRLTGASGRVERVLRVTGLWEVLRYDPERVDPMSQAAS